MKKHLLQNLQGFLAVSVLIGAWITASYIETHYSMEGIVKNNGTVVDAAGEEWATDDACIYAEGTKVKIIFDTALTDNTRYDDIVVKVKPIK